MNRLPLPNWNNSPNLNPDGNFSAFLNIGYRSFPFIGQQYRSIPSQNIALRPPFQASGIDRRAQCQEQINMAPFKALPQKPISKDFSCDVCERSFKSQQILQAHLQSHVKCDYEDCSFSASRKMLKLHFIQNHAKGRMRIKLDTPEEIEKWREQRRKRYPTLANIQKKIAEEKARRENGQIAETETFRYQGKRQRRRNSRHFNRQRNSKYQNPVRKPEKQQPETQILCENEVSHHAIEKQEAKSPAGDPLSFLLVNSNNNSDGEQKHDGMTATCTHASGSVPTSALAALCSYGGDSCSDDSDTEKEINNNQAMNPIKTNNSDQRLPNQTDSSLSPSTQRVSRKRKRDLQKNKNTKSRKVTLLEKLLAPEIRHEHNIILQCIRYIVKNDYFDEQ